MTAITLGLVTSPVSSSTGGSDCALANREVAEAQAFLSRASREAIVRADELALCKQRGGACVVQRRLYDAALVARHMAMDAMHAASAHARRACY
jgi:hypothetical protein